MTKLLSSKQDILDYFQNGCTPKEDWKIGTEHEKFAFSKDDLSPIRFDGDSSITAYFKALNGENWEPLIENDQVFGLKKKSNGATITLEPGGQIELSGAPLPTLHDTCLEVHHHMQESKEVLEKMNIGMLGMGVHPTDTHDQSTKIQKDRYAIMRNYLSKQGNHALDMMHRTCTIQVNLDYASEEDMIKKMRVGLALQPFATAIFANSPFREGKMNGHYSFRSHIWTDTDPQRCGMLPFVFDEDFGFEAYVDYALNIPMYCIHRDGSTIAATEGTFKQYLEGSHPQLGAEYQPNLDDWNVHLTTIYPEVRLKHYIEMRGADAGSIEQLTALPAFWVGLIYDQDNLDELYAEIQSWDLEDILKLRNEVPKTALHTEFRGQKVSHYAKRFVQMARKGLEKRNLLNELGNNEAIYLSIIEDIVFQGRTQAEVILDYYQNKWDQDMKHLFNELAY